MSTVPSPVCARPFSAARRLEDELQDWIGPDTTVVSVGEGCVLPGFVEAHGHPLMEAVALSDATSMAGTRCCRADYQSRRWTG